MVSIWYKLKPFNDFYPPMRKNILLLGHSYATQFIDISNQYTRLFDPSIYCVTVAYLVGEPNDIIRQKHLAENVLFLNFSRKAIGGLKLSPIKKVLALCRQHHFEIVVAQRYKPTYIMMWAAKFVKIPRLFFVMHELGTLNHPSRKLLVAALAQKNMIFAGVSNAVRDDMRKNIWRVPREKVITLYNMIDVEWTQSKLLTRDAAREKLQLSPTDFIFGNIGRLAKNKDQVTLLHAFKKIKGQCPQAKLVIIGDGLLDDFLKQQAKQLQIQDDVLFTGYITDCFRLIPAFDVFISASIQEAFGRVLLEAMIAKTPIIATAVNGVPEVIGNTGPLITAKKVDEMAVEMQKSYHLGTEDRIKWGIKGYQRAVADFSLQRFHEIFWSIS